MASITKQIPASPARAARRRAAVDQRLDTELFKALADPTRANLLACLMKCRRPCSVGEVAACCNVDFSVVARHLGLLARAGILAAEKSGRTVWYRPRCAELSERLRALADAIDECRPGGESATCRDSEVCGGGSCVPAVKRGMEKKR